MGKIFDTTALQKLDEDLSKFSPEQCHQMMFNAVVAGANVLKYNTQMSLAAKMGPRASRKLRGRNVSLMDGVKISNDKTLCESKVSISGFSRWFELGTDIRTTKKGYNRGQISAINFFASARNSSDGAISSAIASSIENQLKIITQS